MDSRLLFSKLGEFGKILSEIFPRYSEKPQCILAKLALWTGRDLSVYTVNNFVVELLQTYSPFQPLRRKRDARYVLRLTYYVLLYRVNQTLPTQI
jgi:hypothetical protein